MYRKWCKNEADIFAPYKIDGQKVFALWIKIRLHVVIAQKVKNTIETEFLFF